MPLYALTIFSSSFLLFLVQPLLAKQILPWFGGSAAVWAVCLVFFQFLLFAGYAYADWITRRLGLRQQWGLHVFLLAVSVAFLPIFPDVYWKPLGSEDPTWRILGLLTFTIGLPYFLLATTGPLIQSWCALKHPTAPVYRLFALSNFAALLALLSYPVLLEPWLSTSSQSYLWSTVYAVFVILCGLAATYSLRWRPGQKDTAVNDAPLPSGTSEKPPALREYVVWLLFSAMGAFMLLAVTNHLTQEITPVPFLWVLPLAVYLITFILCFEGHGHYRRHRFVWLVFLTVIALAWKLNSWMLGTTASVPLNLVGLFALCMFFHGELAERKPAPRYLTRFYLMVALGGAIGGMAVGLVAVRVFDAYYEFGLGLLATLLIAAWVVRRQRPALPAAALAAFLFSAYQIQAYADYLKQNSIVMVRNFYGTLRVQAVDVGNLAEKRLRLFHGATVHGEQYQDPIRRSETTTYYGPTSGVGRAIDAMDFPGRRIGIIGMGTGTLATYGRPGDVYRFYELNPQVIQLAHQKFSFLASSGAHIEEVPGDARLALEGEPPQNFDVLVIDAFSSDAIPAHLITREALAVYLRHIKSTGVMAFHVSNRYLQLAPVIERLAANQGLAVAQIIDDRATPPRSASHWVLVARNSKQLENTAIAPFATPIEAIPGLGVWTDDFNNLFQVLKTDGIKICFMCQA